MQRTLTGPTTVVLKSSSLQLQQRQQNVKRERERCHESKEQRVERASSRGPFDLPPPLRVKREGGSSQDAKAQRGIHIVLELALEVVNRIPIVGVILPTAEEVEAFKAESKLKFGSEGALHGYVQTLLDVNKVAEAWKVLLANQ